MLDIKILLDERSNFTGCITLFLNQGGVRSAKSDRVLTVKKLETFEPIRSILERPQST